VGRIAFLTDRSPAEALPALSSLGLDVKTEPLDPGSLAFLHELGPSAIFVDAEENPEQGFRLLAGLAAAGGKVPVIVLTARQDLERFDWAEFVDDFVHSGCSAPELQLRLKVLARRAGDTGEGTLRLGPLSINVDTYNVQVGGRTLDLTYKEFELIRFLVQNAGRVFTRSTLLQEVWGYNFYGGTRTVDVHVRRLRAKLGPEHEALIQTVRGVGYRADAKPSGE
jgi:DNA-binding response OmpR family regulator